jgi:hypothetical protein
MFGKTLLLFALFLSCFASVEARALMQGSVSKDDAALADHFGSRDMGLRAFPLATVAVYRADGETLATIYSSSNGAQHANPFTASSKDAAYAFYADNGLYLIRFSGTGIKDPWIIGPVNISDPSETYDPRNYNVRGDWNGSRGTDDTAALTAMFAAIPDYAHIVVPVGFRMKITRTITLTTRVGLVFEGAGSPKDYGAPTSGASELYWAGPAGGTMLFLDRCGHVTIKGITFTVNGATNANTAIDIDGVNPPRISTDNRIINCLIDGSRANNASFIAIKIGYTGASNNEFNRVEDTSIWCSESVPGVGTGIDIGSSGSFQSKGNLIFANGLNQCGKGVNIVTGSAQVMYNHSSANDYEVYISGAAGDAIVVGQNNFEGCKGCFYSDGFNGPIEISHNRIYAQYTREGQGVFTFGARAGQAAIEGNSVENLPAGAFVYDGSLMSSARVSIKGNRYPSNGITKAQVNYASFDTLNLAVRLTIEDERNVSDLAQERQYNGQSVQIQNKDAVTASNSTNALTVTSSNGNNNATEVIGIRSSQSMSNGGGASTPYTLFQADFGFGASPFNFALGYRARLPTNGGPGNNVYGFYVTAPAFSRTVTNVYGLYLENLKGANVTNAYGVRQVGSTVTNQFDGAIRSTGIAFANLGTPAPGTSTYCTNCHAGTSLCTGGGAGAWAFRTAAGIWTCPF